MKHKRIWLSGMAAGIVLSMSLTAFAAPLIQEVKAFVRDDYHFTVNGQEIGLTGDSHILTYDGRAYLPVRLLGEQLNAEIEWDDAAKTIHVTTEKPGATTPDPNCAENSSKSAIVPPAPEVPSNYKALPQTSETSRYTLKAVMASQNNEGNRIWFSLKNKTDETLQLEQSQTKLSADGKEYAMELDQAANFDKRWYSSLYKDDEIEGYLLLPEQLNDHKELHIELKLIFTNPYTGKMDTEFVPFDLAL